MNINDYWNNQPVTEVDRGKAFFLQSFRSKRFANPIQEEAVVCLIIAHGFEKFKQGVTWAATLGMSRGQAIISLQTALPKWGRKKCRQNKGDQDYFKQKFQEQQEEDSEVVEEWNQGWSLDQSQHLVPFELVQPAPEAGEQEDES